MANSETQYCPICGNEVFYSSRYPNYVCEDCEAKAVDEEGKLVYFHNTSLVGYGCQGKYKGTNNEYNHNICYIRGIECKAEEAYFGGIVIQTIQK